MIVVNDDQTEIEITTADGERYLMYHEQDCCESVWVEDIAGDLEDLIGTPLLMAEVTSQDGENNDEYGTSTWTFYRAATIKGSVTIRWCGTSNGYYSEGVSFALLSSD
ncbi:hypothetical protein [Agrobacterium sp. GD03642]|uniref:DUF7448 domain-containing protein n=1 Tax=Agrobacterium sp. GD03642 TaxID=2975356 RepID=UPI00244B957C|nr:hypothetical protein [Agrobacterium sp. GD03642]MDH2227910.1 hypothetical protein [Agrobacterium sp. GD03642]